MLAIYLYIYIYIASIYACYIYIFKFNSNFQQMHEFDEYFQLAPLLRYHRVVLLRDFMRDVAPAIWPPARRKGEDFKLIRNSYESHPFSQGFPFFIR